MAITIDEAALKKLINDATENAVKKGINAYRAETSRESTRKREIKAVRDKLAAYRQHKRTLTEEVDFTEAEKYEYRLQFLEDLMGSSGRDSDRTENILLAREEKRKALLYELATLESAIQKFYDEVSETCDEVRSRWYRIMYAYYIDEESKSIEDIAEAECVGRTTAFRDLDKACGVILEYIV